MAVAGLITWVIAALGGLYLLAIWLIEYDPDFQHAAATRLAIPVVAGHVLFAVGGLVLWVAYLITSEEIFCLAAASGTCQGTSGARATTSRLLAAGTCVPSAATSSPTYGYTSSADSSPRPGTAILRLGR